MNHRKFFKGTGTLSLIFLCLGSARCADQPGVKCTVTSGAASARLQLVDKTGTCDNVMFPFADTGDVIGLEAYSPIVTDPNINQEVTSVALQGGTLGALFDNATAQGLTDKDPTHHPYALGKFDKVYPDSQNLCTLSNIAPAEQDLPDVPAHMDADGNAVPDQPATHIKYEWSNVRVIVTVESIGTQTFGDLTYTQDGCVAHYHVALLTPNVSCQDAADATKIDPSLCNSESDPSKGFSGSGIGPGIKTTCDPMLQMCLPDKLTP